MLYNIDKKRIKQDLDCIECPNYDKQDKRCKGIGKTCFEFDQTTQTCIDPITKLPCEVINEK